MPNSLIQQFRDRVPVLHQRLMLGCALGLSVLLAWPQPKPTQSSLGFMPLMLGMGLQHGPQQLQQFPVAELTAWLQSQLHIAPAEDPFIKVYNIRAGDSLSRIFARYGLNYQTVQQVMAADESLLALDVLRPGNRLTLQLDDDGQLQSMELYVHAGKKVLYKREAPDEFSYQELLDEGIWQNTILVGEVFGSFYASAQRAEQQAAVADEINQKILNISDVAVQTSAGAEQTASTSRELARLAEQLQQLVGRFTLA